MAWISDPNAWIALCTLTLLEIVLGIDNIVFISILAERLPEHQREKARRIGLAVAMLTRILLLLSIAWLATLTQPLFSIFEEAISGRDLILLGGGLFLIFKSTVEIHEALESTPEDDQPKPVVSFASVILQIALLDIVFSLDSVITAVGLAQDIAVMVIAIIVAIMTMMFFAGAISRFVNAHPTIKMLALSFLLLIGLALIAESLDVHVPKGYIYFAMGFSIFVELLNLKARKARNPVKLRPHKPKLPS